MQDNQSCINSLWETCTHSQQGYIHTYLQLQLHMISYITINDHSLLELVVIGSLEQRYHGHRKW